MKNLNTKLSSLCLTLCLSSAVMTSAFAEVTRQGDPVTYELGGVNYTYFYADGTPVPAGTRFINSLAGAVLLNADGSTSGALYKSREDAAYFAERAKAACAPGAPKYVVGAGSGGDPCSNPSAGGNGVTITGKENVKPDAATLPKIGTGPIDIKKAKELHDGSVDPKDSKGVKNGPFDADYNGIKMSKDPKALDDKAYVAKSLEMTSFLWGIAEVGEKLCKPVGTKHPASLVSWWSVIKNYVAAEKARDKLVKARIDILQKKMSEMIADKANASAMQLKAIEFQIESLNVSIDSISGSLLFSLDAAGPESRATARLPWREALLTAAKKATKENELENKDNHAVFESCSQAIAESATIAGDACKRTKTVTECTFNGENEGAGAESCVQKVVADPVPGSCELAKSLPEFRKGPVQNFANLYYVNPIPSKSLNEGLIKLGKSIDVAVTGFPKSNDADYNWSEPLIECQDKALMTVVKDNGMICPANASDKSYDKTKVDALGSAVAQNAGPDYKLPDASKVTESAKAFLDTMGISGDALNTTIKSFQDDWNKTDMSLGQPLQRQDYFKNVTGITLDMISADQAKLAELLTTRARLLKLYEDTKKLFQTPATNGVAVGTTPATGPFVVGPGPAPASNQTKPATPAPTTATQPATSPKFVVGPTSSNANTTTTTAPTTTAPATTTAQRDTYVAPKPIVVIKPATPGRTAPVTAPKIIK